MSKNKKKSQCKEEKTYVPSAHYIPNFANKRDANAFLLKKFYLGNRERYFREIVHFADQIKNESIRSHFIFVAGQYPDKGWEHSKRKIDIALSKKHRKHKLGPQKELTDDDRRKRNEQAEKNAVMRKILQERSKNHFIKFISVPMGGQNKRR